MHDPERLIDYAWQQYWLCAETIREEGLTVETMSGSKRSHPLLAVQHRYFEQFAKLYKLQTGEDVTEDDIEALLGRHE